MNFLSCVNDYIEDMATFTALAKIYFTKYFCNTKVSGVGEIFVKRKFSHIQYYNIVLAPPPFDNYCICPLLTKILDETLIFKFGGVAAQRGNGGLNSKSVLHIRHACFCHRRSHIMLITSATAYLCDACLSLSSLHRHLQLSPRLTRT